VLLKTYREADPPCPNCSSGEVRRLVSSFATVRSEEGSLDDFGSGMEGMDSDEGAEGGYEDGGSGGWAGDDDF
jgi:hypothetical protein